MNKVCFGILGSLALTTMASFLFLSSSSVNGTADEVILTIPTACSLDSTLDTTHIKTMNNSEYASEIGTTTFKVMCNDSDGFAIYAVGNSNDEYGNTGMLSTTAGVNNIVTGTSTSGPTSNWAMKLVKVTDSSASYNPANLTIENGFSSYSAIPSTYTKVASYSSSTDSTLGSKLQSTYAVWISATQPADTYTGKVKYTMVHPASEVPLQPQTAQSGCINYFPNGSNVVGTMGCQSISASATGATLLASNFSRVGYGFAGWSNKFDYATNPNQEGIKFYGPQEDITFTAGQYTGTNDGLALYAVWVKSAGNLQDATKVATLCGTGTGSLTTAPTNGTANLSSVSALTDQRDNQTYAIAKLADGKCWMIENLRLESTAAHNSDSTLAQGYGTSSTYGNFSGLADVESTGFSTTYSANSLYSNDGSNNTINIGTSNYPAYRMPRYNNWNNQSTSANRPQNPITNDATNSTTNAGMYSYGNYYTWHAAIADLTYNGTNNSSVTNTSLCPSGWHLPTGGMAYASGDTGGVNVTGDTSTFREFYNLGYKTMDEAKTAYEDTPNSGYAYYSSNTTNTAGNTATKAFRSFPNNFLYSGYFDTSSAYRRGSSIGLYWSSTAFSNYNSYNLYLYSSLVSPGTNRYSKYYGVSIRCTVSAGT